ncbi:MAG: VOC family protein [Phycisphaerae bacterium]
MSLSPYLSFNGRCEEAIEYYRKALGAEVVMKMRFSDSPQPHDPKMVPPGTENNIMHAELRIGDASLMCSDGCHSEKPAIFQGISLSLSLPDAARSQKFFNALAADGQVQMPFGKTFFSPGFGMVVDRFGVSWMLYTLPAEK